MFKKILKALKKVDYVLIAVILFVFYVVFILMGKIIFLLVNKNKKNKKSFCLNVKNRDIYQFKSAY